MDRRKKSFTTAEGRLKDRKNRIEEEKKKGGSQGRSGKVKGRGESVRTE